jgi:BMFP domain-containing protein YqiC
MATEAAPLTLYQIEDELMVALDTIEMIDPESGPALRAELEQQIAHLVAAEISKVDGVTRMLAHFESQAELATQEIKRLQRRKKRFEDCYARLEACARLAMECVGKRKIEGATSSLALRKNPPSLFISAFDRIPAEYLIVKQDISVNKDAVKRALKAGISVPGAELVQGDRLERR